MDRLPAADNGTLSQRFIGAYIVPKKSPLKIHHERKSPRTQRSRESPQDNRLPISKRMPPGFLEIGPAFPDIPVTAETVSDIEGAPAQIIANAGNVLPILR